MGDWEDIFGSAGMQADFAPWNSPSWYDDDDWENEVRENGYLTLKEWNAQGKVIKQGEKGMFLPRAKLTVFSEGQVEASNNNSAQRERRHFDTFEDAVDWARNNPGKIITRSSDGNGFTEK